MPLPKRILSILSWLTWTFLSWAAACAVLEGFSKNTDIRMWWWAAVIAGTSAAVIFGWRALCARAALGRWAGFVFWLVGFPLLTLLVLNYRFEFNVLTHVQDRRLLMLSCVLAGLTLALVALMQKRSGRETGVKVPGWGTLLDIAGGVACFALLLAAADFITMKKYVEPLRQMMTERWVELGRPMDVFEKNLKPVAENESLRELTRDLKPFGVVTFYKTGSGPKGREIKAENTIQKEIPRETVEFISSIPRQGGPILVPAKVAADLDARAGDFDRLYRGVLQREAPVWGVDPREGYSLVCPNWLTARVLAQWVKADACHRLEKGNMKGAAEAVAVEKKIVQDFGREPLLVSQMIKVAIECLMADVEARLPEDPEAMKQLAADVEAERAQFQYVMQAEAWVRMRTFEDKEQSKAAMSDMLARGPFLPAWLQEHVVLPALKHSFYQVECLKAGLYDADIVEISGRAPQLVSSDLGTKEMESAELRNPSVFMIYSSRAWLRLNVSLLLREQAQAIRFARARLQEGKTGALGEMESVVVPGSKWVMSAVAEGANDTNASGFTMKLTPLPAWAAKNDVVINDDFWFMPLDGSKAWQLRQAANKGGGL